jgi:hypothetical protein
MKLRPRQALKLFRQQKGTNTDNETDMTNTTTKKYLLH